jgi:23S rRNA pseudouridine1911/1915/1917 synthase
MPVLNRGFEYRKKLGPEADGHRVLAYLLRYYPAFGEHEWRRRIEEKRVLLDGVPACWDQPLRMGQLLSWVRPAWHEPDVPRPFAILYLDQSLLAVAKPAGLPTLPGGGSFMENTLLAMVRGRFPGASPVHRLGRGTSGLVLFSLTREAARKMHREWEQFKILKIYHALISGSPAGNSFTVDARIGTVPHRFLKTLHAASPSGKPASSHVAVLERRKNCSLVRVRIDTGRPHQIRIHMAAAGHPLLGDPLYRPGGIPDPGCRTVPSETGYHLHSMLLGLHHPDGGAWTEIFCAPPPVLRPSGDCKSCVSFSRFL